MKIDVKGWLVPEHCDPTVVTVESVRSYKLVTPQPLGIVWHYTGGAGSTTYAATLAEKIRTYDRATDRPASWHVLVSKTGVLYQSVSFLRGSWHVGKSGKIAGEDYSNVNRVTIGIELENAGRLKRISGKWYCWPYWEDKETETPDAQCEVPANRAMRVQGEGYFDAFTDAQIRSACVLAEALKQAYILSAANLEHGHKEFDPLRREDPGPLFRKTHLPRIIEFAVKM